MAGERLSGCSPVLFPGISPRALGWLVRPWWSLRPKDTTPGALFDWRCLAPRATGGFAGAGSAPRVCERARPFSLEQLSITVHGSVPARDRRRGCVVLTLLDCVSL